MAKVTQRYWGGGGEGVVKKSQGDEEAEGDAALRRGHHAGKAALSCDPSAHCHRHVVLPLPFLIVPASSPR
ncbi:hypothetical protein CEXT_130051 [Caerostris extrusa]|uniref:Uncharacterized protein n=1 Tax=Caerostris extrusa TaxID=172846 RepID=A0AAV4QU06_CAEEX|nr:hypothetical protein CEXT_130051 [Caerostris extrusa]